MLAFGTDKNPKVLIQVRMNDVEELPILMILFFYLVCFAWCGRGHAGEQHLFGLITLFRTSSHV